MIHIEIDRQANIVTLEPSGALREQDFNTVSEIINNYLSEEGGHIQGLIVISQHFPGWDSFGAMLNHFQFIKGFHQKIAKVALVSDSPAALFAEHVTSHFLSAKIKRFPHTQFADAKKWVLGI